MFRLISLLDSHTAHSHCDQVRSAVVNTAQTRLVGVGPGFCWTRAKFLETSSSLRPSNFREISGKSVTTGDRQGTAPPSSMSRRPTTTPTPKQSAHHPVVVSKHESCADGISKGSDLLLPKHELQEVGFPWKFPEISGNFRRSAVGGKGSAVGGRLRTAVGLPPPEVRFPWKFPESCFLSRGQISKRMSRNLYLGQGRSPPTPNQRYMYFG